MTNTLPAAATHAPCAPDGTVLFAVGDVHGRDDLLDALIAEIGRQAEGAAEAGKAATAIFLGDYVDRGPGSRAVIERLMGLDKETRFESICLRGNHEQFLLDLIDGHARTAVWLDYGGIQTLAAYGLDVSDDDGMDLARLAVATRRAVPQAHIAFMRSLGLFEERGDYLFVHAGLRPDRLLAEQSDADLLWYRSYSDETPVHGKAVVHGHTPHNRPVDGRWRIDVDTEAWASGVLTAVRLEGTSRRYFRAEMGETGLARVVEWDKVDRAHHRPNVSAAHDAAARRTHMNRIRRESSGFWRSLGLPLG